MEPATAGIVLILALLLFLGSGVWVAISLFGVGVIGIAAFTGAPAGKILATTSWGSSTSWALTALPLFIWMAEILYRSRLSEDMFHGLAPWLTRLPGRLMHVNIFGCGVFAAISGSSAATAATIGKMSIPELLRRGYDERMTIGTLAGSGTLGLLIPPSIILIVYGVTAEISIARLFIAGVLPGLMLLGLFSATVVVWSLLNPGKTPPSDIQASFRDKLYGLRRLVPVLALIVGVLGSIYGGVATPTEAAAFGVVGALALSALTGSLSRQTFIDSLMSATRTSCMIAFILAGAAFLSVAMGFTGVPRALAGWIGAMNLTPYALIGALTVLFVVLGCFLDGISVIVLTTSVVLPMVREAGIDLLWFGIYIVLVVEMSQITPPVGFNLFVLQGLTGHNIFYVARAALPFFLVLCLAVALIAVFPEVATYLPSQMTSR
ncbi:MAG: TRAP transporter large permease subunit [Alphaproteobacteria bacterium]|jgi:tripartite ATP-independent transporter DctM subunit|nr:TRAP transporter large permease subunit [Alphaproteobacteria bacterium]MDP6515335.1 TRAP transporter large permease subunit [Alphaproteobacteria bacterium]